MRHEASVRTYVNQAAKAAGARMASFERALMGTVGDSARNGRAAPVTIIDGRRMLKGLRTSMVNTERDMTDRVVNDLLDIAEFDSKASRSDALDVSSSIYDAIWLQTMRDGSMALKTLRETILIARAKIQIGTPESTAMTLAHDKTARKLKFTYIDAARRRWKAPYYVELMVRWQLFYLVNLLERQRLIESGTVVAQVSRPGHKTNGMIFQIGEGDLPDTPSYLEIEEEIFHPNSQALVAAIEEE